MSKELGRMSYADCLAERPSELASVDEGYMAMVHRNLPGIHIITQGDDTWPTCWCEPIYVVHDDTFDPHDPIGFPGFNREFDA